MKQNKENETSLRRESLKTLELEKQLEKANEVIKRLEVEMKQVRRIAATEQIDLKLISEDQAAILAKAEMEKNLLMKQYGGEIASLRGKLDDDNKIWMQRFDIRKEEFLSEEKRLKEESSRVIDENLRKTELQKKRLKEELARELEQKISSCEQQKKERIRECEERVRGMQGEMERERERLVAEKEGVIKELERKHEVEIKKLNKSHDLIATSIKSEKKSEENMHQETKNRMEVQKKTLRDEIERLGAELVKANEEIVTLKNQNGDLNSQILELVEKSRVENEEWVRKLELEQAQHQKYIGDLGARYEENTTSLLKNHFTHVQKLELNLTVLKTKNDQQKSLHNTQIEQIKQIYEERPSREQDLMSLTQVQEKLYKKMKQIEILKNQLKWCKLELDNKEQVYNKIFACETKPMIPMIHKERRRKFANSINHREVKSNKIIGKAL